MEYIPRSSKTREETYREDLSSSDEEVPLEQPSQEHAARNQQYGAQRWEEEDSTPVGTDTSVVEGHSGSQNGRGVHNGQVDVELPSVHGNFYSESSSKSPKDEHGKLLSRSKAQNPMGSLALESGTNKLRPKTSSYDEELEYFSDDASTGSAEEPEVTQHGPTSGISGASTNYVNSIIGAGIIGLPFALREAGVISGVILIVIVGFIADYSTRLMVGIGVRVNRRTYEELCYFAFGKKGFFVVTLSMFVFAYGAMIAYLIIIGDTVDAAFSSWVAHGESASRRRAVIAVVAFMPVLPLSVVKNMSRLARSSGLSLLAVFWIISVVIIRAITGVGEAETQPADERKVDVIRKKFFPAVGVVSFAFICHHSSFFVFRSLKNPTEQRWAKTTHISVLIATAASLTLSVTAYGIFWDKTEANVLNNFAPDDVLVNITRLAYALTMILTYPLEIFVARQCIHSLIDPKKAPISDKRHYIVCVALWVTSLGIALAVTDLGVVLELTGGLSATIIGFIMPASLHLKTTRYRLLPWRNPKDEQKDAWKSLLPAMIVLLFGGISLVASFVTVANDLAHPHRSAGPA
eukprot:gb/GECG01000079.1/.p1 GENE.gb/GECG01000079.1/~~gb/GECG01000079.1/.p1  ORF type:complete len:577 (+),score=46.18 gb/GECG01000079.1/:1-1731(+)